MADELRVVGDELSSLAGQMDEAARLLDNEVSGVKGREGDVGHQGVVDAALSFERHWGDGRTRVREQAESLSQMLTDSLASFDEVESDLAAALTPDEQAVSVKAFGSAVAV